MRALIRSIVSNYRIRARLRKLSREWAYVPSRGGDAA